MTDLAQGFAAAIEEQIVLKAKTLLKNDDGGKLFKTVEQWKWQIGATEGGLESFQRFAPFLFVAYEPPTEGIRQGGSLQEVMRFALTIGVHSKEAGIARTGDDYNIGITKMRDIVIAAFDKWHPGEAIACDPLYFKEETLLVSSQFLFAVDLFFESKLIID